METPMKGIEKLQFEYQFLRKGGLSHIGGSAGPIRKNYLHWKGCFIGPKKTPFEGGLYFIEMKFTENYPSDKPKVRMRTKIWHPNIAEDTGEICVDYIKANWNSENNVLGIVDTVFDILEKPNFNSKLNTKCNKETFEKTVIEYKNKYAFQNQEYEWNDWDGEYNKIF
jgi:ubiquitin-protein ligase